MSKDDTIRQTKIKKFIEQRAECFMCYKTITLYGSQLAHRIPKSKMNLRKYGDEMINHPDNMRLVCSLACNSAVLVRPGGIFEKDIVESIRKKLLLKGVA